MHPHIGAVPFSAAQVPFRPFQRIFISLGKYAKGMLPVFFPGILKDEFPLFLQFYCAGACKGAVLFINPQQLQLSVIYLVERHGAQYVIHHGIAGNILFQHVLKPYTFNLFCPDSPEVYVVLIRQKGFKYLNGHGMEEIIPLSIGAPHVHQEINLLFCLNPFRNYAQPHDIGQPCDRLQDFHALAHGFTIHLKEFHVNLKYVHIDVLQHVQGGITASKVIHQYRKAGFPQ